MSTSSLTFEFPVRNSWPVGFGFRPTEEELITHYLENKMLGNESRVQYIREVDLYSYEPHQLPRLSIFESDNHEWFFFRAESDLYHYTDTDTKTKTKTKRITPTGSWKSTGGDKEIKARGTDKVIGYRKILVFPKGKNVRTKWIIHEYRLHLTQPPFPYQRSFVVCRLKEDADQVSSFDNDEQNNSVTSRPKRKVRRTEVSSDGQLMQHEAIAHQNNHTLTDYELHSPLYSNQEPTYSDFHASHDFGSQVSDLPLQSAPAPAPAPAEEDLDVNDFIDSILVDDRNDFNVEELLRLVNQNHGSGFSPTIGTDVALGWQNNDISSSFFDDLGSLGVHMPTIKESRRGHLPVKRLHYKPKEEDVDELHGGLSSVSSESGISMNSDVSDDGPTSFKPPKDLVPTSNRYKAKEYERRIKFASPTSRLSITDSSNGKYGCVGCKGRGFSCILTTKQIHHKSSVPFVYVAKAFLGIIMFFLFVQEMLLYGSW